MEKEKKGKSQSKKDKGINSPAEFGGRPEGLKQTTKKKPGAKKVGISIYTLQKEIERLNDKYSSIVDQVEFVMKDKLETMEKIISSNLAYFDNENLIANNKLKKEIRNLSIWSIFTWILMTVVFFSIFLNMKGVI